MERERTAVEEREWKRLDEWADAMGIGDLLAILCVNGFLTVSSIIHITMDDLKEMGMEKVGDRKRVLLAAAEGKALHKATQPSLLPAAVLHLPTVLAPGFPKIKWEKKMKMCPICNKMFNSTSHKIGTS